MKISIKKILFIIEKKGLKGFFRIIFNYIHSPKSKSLNFCKNLITNKEGIEIGGPSDLLFSKEGILPIYPFLKKLDNCNFSSQTIWEGKIEDGYTYKYNDNKSYGYQYVLDATDLNKIQSEKYDFLLSSHVIEHVANPIKALFEWTRVVKKGGDLIVVVPHKDGTFDHKRNVTALSHLIDDFNNNTKEDDLTHLDEILEYHDLEVDPGIKVLSEFRDRSLKNFENRCLHHHVFNTYLAVKMIDFVKLQILLVETVSPCHIIIVAKKTEYFDNKDIIKKLENHELQTHFDSDKKF